jgi:O-succinylhomoserine sulfhydrylase
MPNDERFPSNNPAWRPETVLVHAGTTRSAWGETSEALHLTQGFVYQDAEQAEARFKQEDPGYQYTRFGNPTISMFEDRLKALEGAEECRATATGMAAVTAAILSYVKTGDHIVAARAMFGSCRNVIEAICSRFGVTSTLIDGKDLDAWREAIRPNTKMFFFETPSNPNLELVDIAEVCKIAREKGILTIVDNVFATPMLQRPLALGADIVVYSATKHIDGQGRCLAGAVLGKTDFITKYVQEWLRQTGPSVGPFNAWIMLKGLETLPVRVKAQ